MNAAAGLGRKAVDLREPKARALPFPVSVSAMLYIRRNIGIFRLMFTAATLKTTTKTTTSGGALKACAR